MIVIGLALAAPVPPGLQWADVPGTSLRLAHSRLVEVERPTSLQFGLDGRLYVSRMDGLLLAFTIERIGVGQYRVTATERIDALQKVPNQDEDGTLRPDLKTRLVTGILIEGTAEQPVVYATSSDPRVGDKGTSIPGIDTDSGVISRLTRVDGSWVREDLVVGLPRSGEDHACHGLARHGDGLIVTQGGNTNMGAPSKSFSLQTETPLSAALLSVDLSQAPIDVRRGPGVTVFASGFRNPYDVLVAGDGRVYTVDNGPNRTWGGPPADCSHTPVEGGTTYPDTLHVVKQGDYGGHANPARGECTFLPPEKRPTVLASFPTSTNGLAEYTASGPLQGSLLTVSFGGELWQVTPSGTKTVLAKDFGAWPLDVTTQGDDDPFPGTIWVAVHATERIQVFEPTSAP